MYEEINEQNKWVSDTRIARTKGSTDSIWEPAILLRRKAFLSENINPNLQIFTIS